MDPEELAEAAFPLSIPAQGGQVSSGGLVIAQYDLLGPKLGWVWDVRRISLFGLTAATDSVSLWKVTVGAVVGAQAQAFVCKLTGPGAFQPFGLGQCMLRANESLMITGTGLTTANGAEVIMSGDGICVAAKWVALYLL